MKTICEICPHRCLLEDDEKGLCRARINRGGIVVADNYGKITALSLDPIEKKPLRQFFPGSLILSAGSYGCNMRCSFCQNSDISMAERADARAVEISPEILVEKAIELIPRGNIGIAYTYNEPLIGYEFVYDCAVLAKNKGLKNVLVTNGYVNDDPLIKLLPFIDAMNIDLKAFTDRFYKRMAGDLETVKRTIRTSSENSHVEVTTLIIPDENDSAEEMRALSGWLASVNSKIPLHVTRFFPAWHMTDKNATSVETVRRLADIAREKLKYVYTGNC